MDKFNIEAITIAPYQHNKNDSIIINQENGYKEIIEIGKLINIDLKEYVYRGAINSIKNNFEEDNEAVNKIIEITNKNEKTYILALGALTNIALAISKDLKDNFYGIKEDRVIWDIIVVSYLLNLDYFE